uniref:Lipocalin/cytosolic fatty-acid binding domain-containing protein n=1 Tax=Mus spicilegus TaxID=10103 RepID=A0A8C6GME7_MUSSI
MICSKYPGGDLSWVSTSLPAPWPLESTGSGYTAQPQLSDKWFLIGVASRNPEVQQSIQEKMTVFLHLTLNLIKDTVEIQEYDTLGDQCEYYSNHLGFQKENGTLSLYGEGVDSRLSGRVLQGYKGTAEQCS